MFYYDLPKERGLYEPTYEHDSCGVGFVANLKGKKSYGIIDRAIKILVNLTHRGAVGSDEDTGDGAGILFQIPHKFFVKVCDEEKIELPENGKYAVGMLFLPKKKENAELCFKIIKQTISEYDLKFLGVRKVPVDSKKIGKVAQKYQPDICQIFVTSKDKFNKIDFEKKIYIIRKVIENKILNSSEFLEQDFYIPSFSNRTIVYKGLLLATQIKEFYKDLNDTDFESALAIVHQRYSTNTFPTWALAQPFRFLAHNGEINTLRGNSNWMYAREKTIKSKIFKKELEKMLPIIAPNCSDSMALDNVLEFLVACGRPLAHSMMMLIPEAWGRKYPMSADKRGFYEYHSILMEPWDGPAAIAFTDGEVVGANLDRNGLRPARYLLTKDDYIYMASEAGVLPIEGENIKKRGRLQPGKMFFIDIKQGRIISDKEIKSMISRSQPYRRWVAENKIEIGEMFDISDETRINNKLLLRYQKTFGYTFEDIHTLIIPTVTSGKEPVGSMGNDAALAVLSETEQLLFKYFKQLFAQVTNPAIDSIREEQVMSLMSYIGIESNLLEETPQHAKLLKLKNPILTNHELNLLLNAKTRGFDAVKIPILFKKGKSPENELEKALKEICFKAEEAVKNKKALIVLSDRDFDEENIPIPSLLAVSTVHHYLIKKGLRTKIGLIIKTGEAREVMHFALLLGFGVSAINPYVLFETLSELDKNNYLQKTVDVSQAVEKYIKAISKGLLKIFAKMGISTIRSYRGAQIFEAIGLNREFTEKYFPGVITRIGGIGLKEVAYEAFLRHKKAFAEKDLSQITLDSAGEYKFRRNGEKHLWTPEIISNLQQACREDNYEKYKIFSKLINDQLENDNLVTLRALLDIKSKNKPIDISEVEPIENIVKRFVTGAMSFGSISPEVHETIAIAMNRLGSMSNSGEGGEDVRRFFPMENGDSKCSAIKQVASGRFGVTIHYLTNAKEIQIKVAQGAKPGEGGQLPGFKVGKTIAKVRNTVPGITLISPPPHHDIYSIEDLAQLIFDLKNANPEARISVKLVSEAGVGTVAAGVAKAKADMILISGHDGGTGASPLSSIKYAGIPWELGLAETQQTLIENNLRGQVRLQTDGQLRTGRDVVIAALLGAEEFGFGTGALVVMGCVMMRQCHSNTCPVGVATQDPELRKRFKGKPEHLINYFKFVAQEIREIMADLGYKTFDELVGQCYNLSPRADIKNWKAKKIDFKKILFMPKKKNAEFRNTKFQVHNLNNILDKRIIADVMEKLNSKQTVFESKICNTDRSTGIMLSHTISKKYGVDGLKDDTLICEFTGVAGQSFGAFLVKGVTFGLSGSANDYVGKGLSGGKLFIGPSKKSDFDASKNVVAGNTVLYGATSGEAYFNGIAGERFAVRNSGATAVVEGIGDHGCEYMTGGTIVVLGTTGVNFGAGMSGGIAYVLDEEQEFDTFCNLSMIDIEPVSSPNDKKLLKRLIKNHYEYTGSKKAEFILNNWKEYLHKFVKVIPLEYRKVLGLMSKEDIKTEREEVTIG